MSISAMPPCQAACPIHTDVRGYVFAIAVGDVDDAIKIIRQVNPFPSVCSRICTRPCEKKCRRGQVDEPVSIRALKRFAADQTKELVFAGKPVQNRPEKIAIIGSGPAGLTAAHDLALLGYKVTVFEAQKVLGGMLSEGIPEYRLPKDLVKAEIDRIIALGVEPRTGVSLGKDITIEGLLKDFQAVFIAVGSQKSIVPKCHGSDLKGIIPGVEFLKQVSRKQIPDLGKKVAVIGGGHTALDAARTCIRLGCDEVTVLYRRTLEEMPAGKEEVEEAEKEGIKLRYLSAPVSFSGNGKVTRARFVQMQLGEPDASGRRRPVPIENSEFDIEADSVILAIGYTPDSGLLEENGLELKRNGTLSVKDETGITNIAGVFAAGDVVSGPQSVIEAIASGRRVAEAIHCFFRNKSPKEKAGIIALEPLDESITNLISKAERQKMFSLPAEDRIRHFEEIDLGFSKEQALKEAQRCLNCGAGAHIGENCVSCLNCVRICPYDVPSPGKELVAVDINRCQACGICASECPASAITLGIDTMQDSRAEIDKIVDKARQESPEILILGFYCRYRSPLGPPLDRDEVYWIGKCCTGRIDTADLLYPFEFGVDGAVVQICEKDACRHREGNKYLRKHVKEAKKILDITGFNADRLTVITDEEDISGFINTFDELGINPLRKGKKVKP